MSIKITGLDKVLNNYDKRIKADIATNIVNKAAVLVESNAKRLSPVDTGALRSSIKTESSRLSTKATSTVGTSLEYGVYQEFGTVNMKAQPFLHPAVTQSKSKIAQIAKEEIQKAMRV